MIRHLFRLVWSRKRANALVVLEIFFSFLVVFAVLLLGVSTTSNLSRSVGYTSTDVWNVEYGPEAQSESGNSALALEMTNRFIQVVKDLSPVESVAATGVVPYSMSQWTDNATVNGRSVPFDVSDATDEIPSVLRLQLDRGRWFGKQDDGAREAQVIVTKDFARELFGDADPIGRAIPADTRPGSEGEVAKRIIGTMASYRAGGELSSRSHFALFRIDPTKAKEGRAARNLLVRVRPGTPRSFEETLIKTLQATAHDYRFTVESLSEMKASYNKREFLPIGIAALVAVFLILMVALGLTGVLWQNVTKRTKEIGLRRATGATARQISFQILAEIWILTTLALVLGSALVLQLPLLNLLSFITAPVYALSFGLSLLTLYALSSLCALYPGWLATRVSPTEALRHE